jgi:tetratricopeptide (TPR) repeat protein
MICGRKSVCARTALVAVIALALGTAAAGAYVGVVAALAESGDRERMEEAARINPRQAMAQYELGRWYLWTAGDAPRAVAYYRRAASLNPRRAPFWSELAWACFAAGDQSCAGQAFDSATRLAPKVPRYACDRANYLMLTGERAAAPGQLLHCLQLDPSSAVSEFRTYLRAFDDADGLWATLRGVGHTDLQMAYVMWTAESGRAAGAQRYWDQLLADGGRPAAKDAVAYTEQLLGDQAYDDAAAAWRNMQERGVLAASSDGNLVFNSGFEQPVYNQGFDWHVQDTGYVDVELSRDAAYQGQLGLKVRYTVPDNSESVAAKQIIAVSGDTDYVASAYMRSDGISSDSGPRLLVTNPDCTACLAASSEGVTGTTPWHKVEVAFHTPPDTRIIALYVWRPRSRTYPMDISGEAAVDAVSLRPARGR